MPTSLEEIRLDDASIGAFQRDLEVIETEIDREELADLPFADGRIVPLDIQNNEWAQTTTYRRLLVVGMFKLMRSYATDIPMINLLSEEIQQKIYSYIGGYFITDDDIAASLHTGFSIEKEDIQGVADAANQKLNELIAFGDRSLNMPGFVNNPECMYSFSPFRLLGGTTGDNCLAVLNDACTAIVEATQQIEKPDTLLLPVRQYNYLTTTKDSNGVGGNIGWSILKQFLENSPYIKNIEPLNELAGAGVDGTDVMIAYKRHSSKVKAKIMLPLKWKELQRKGMGYERPAKFKYAGVSCRRPMSIHIVGGI
jgi:hypothetical protein